MQCSYIHLGSYNTCTFKARSNLLLIVMDEYMSTLVVLSIAILCMDAYTSRDVYKMIDSAVPNSLR